MPRLAKLFSLANLTLALLTLAACTSSDDATVSQVEINTLNIFFEELAAPGGNVIGVYSYNPDTDQSVERARHRIGDNQAFEMDTDRDKQGYEYLAFVNSDDEDSNKDAVYLLDYDKGRKGLVRKLYSFDSTVCGIYPSYRNDEAVIIEGNRANSTLVSMKAMEVRTSAAANIACDENTDLVFELSFDFDIEDTSQETTLRQESLFRRETILDYTHFEDGVRGKTYYIADDNAGTAYLLDEERNLVWSTEIPGGANKLNVIDAGNDLLIMQAGTRLYWRSTEAVINANEVDSNGANLTIQERVFGLLYRQLLGSDELNPAYFDLQTQGVLVQDGQSLLSYDGSVFENVVSLDPSTISNEFVIVSSREILIAQTYATHSNLIRAFKSDTTWSLTSQPLNGQSADSLQLFLSDEGVHINTLNLGGGTQGVEAHFSDNLTAGFTTYPEAFFARSSTIELGLEPAPLYLVNSDTTGANASLIDPRVYIFDQNQSDGKRVKVDSNGDPVISSETNTVEHLSVGRLIGSITSIDPTIRTNNELSAFIKATAIDTNLASYSLNTWLDIGNPE